MFHTSIEFIEFIARLLITAPIIIHNDRIQLIIAVTEQEWHFEKAVFQSSHFLIVLHIIHIKEYRTM